MLLSPSAVTHMQHCIAVGEQHKDKIGLNPLSDWTQVYDMLVLYTDDIIYLASTSRRGGRRGVNPFSVVSGKRQLMLQRSI